MDSKACDYFFSELRKEVDDIRTEHELEKSVGYFLNKDKLNIVEKVVDRQIFEKHKESIRYFFNYINN